MCIRDRTATSQPCSCQACRGAANNISLRAATTRALSVSEVTIPRHKRSCSHMHAICHRVSKALHLSCTVLRLSCSTSHVSGRFLYVCQVIVSTDAKTWTASLEYTSEYTSSPWHIAYRVSASPALQGLTNWSSSSVHQPKTNQDIL